jgi:hypothetical protein
LLDWSGTLPAHLDRAGSLLSSSFLEPTRHDSTRIEFARGFKFQCSKIAVTPASIRASIVQCCKLDCIHRRGAAEGEGLGNAFLSNIAAVDGIFHVCRAFEDPDVVHVEDRVDPVADLEIIHG